jgi:two-component system, NarL family, response regulator DevR
MTIDQLPKKAPAIGNSADRLDRQPAEAPPIRVFLVDDYELVRRGLTDLLGSTTDLVVVGEAATSADALKLIPAAAPHIALLDSRLPDGSGIDVCRELRSVHPEVSCVILTSHHEDEALIAAVMAGASGYLLKQIRGSSLVDGIRQVAAGQSLFDPAVPKKLTNQLRKPAWQ